MDVSTIDDLFRHMEWADAQVWNAVLACDAACADAGLREWLYHIHMVQLAFLRAWRDVPREAPYPEIGETRSILAWARGYYAQAREHLESLGDDGVDAKMPVPWADMVEERLGCSPGPTSVGETAMQVAMHSAYHRGQVNMLLRKLGGEPPLVDYIAWIWFGRPEPEWPEPAPET